VQEEQDQQPQEETQEPAAEAPPEEPAAEEAPAPAAAEAEAEPAEQLSPSERRKRARATAPNEQRPQRSVEERVRERAEHRAQNAQARRRWRQKRKDRDRTGADSASRIGGSPEDESRASSPGVRKTQQGVVVSSKGDKTITVRIDRVGRHRVYGKVVRQSSTLHAHDERNEAGEGDVVRVVESRPLSRTKRWRLVQVLEKAK
jgi:small subunit ribosomal protein S17